MRRIFIPGFGYTIIMTKNPFRKRKVQRAQIFKNLGLNTKTITPSIETDMC